MLLLIDLSLLLSCVPTGNRSNCTAIELEFSGYVYQLLSSLVSPLGKLGNNVPGLKYNVLSIIKVCSKALD